MKYFDPVDLAENFASVRARMNAACARAARDPAAVRLLAVTKNVPPELVKQAAGLGQELFGENRVQEAKAKIPLCPSRLQWHMIGHLQTNKSRDAVAWFRMVHSVDSLHLARELNSAAEKQSKTIPVLLEVNVGGESTKYGYGPDRLLAEFLEINALPRLEIHGLMAVPPWTDNPERVRPMFAQVRELKKQCEQLLGAPLPELSIGMSHDFEVAIEEGATIVRIGTALFGPRPRLKRPAANPEPLD